MVRWKKKMEGEKGIRRGKEERGEGEKGRRKKRKKGEEGII